MRIIYKYSLKEELKNFVDLIQNYKEYKQNKNLYIKLPHLADIFDLKLHEKIICFLIRQDVYKRPSIENAIKELDIENNLKKVTCYLHAFGVGGWFDVEKQEIHVRWDYHANHFFETLVHEVLHILTYKETDDYATRENIVDGLMEKDCLSKLFNQ